MPSTDVCSLARAADSVVECLEVRRLLSAAVDGLNFSVRGAPGDDVISIELNGTAASGEINGVPFDLVVPRQSRMRVFLDAGNDQLTVTLIGRSIPATVYGGGGDDSIDFLALDETVRIYGEGGNDDLRLSRSTPTTPGSLRTFTYGGDGNDVIELPAAQNMAFGDDGNDRIRDDSIAAIDGIGVNTIDGGNGDDTLSGGAGDDRILGGDGSDLLFGNRGVDTLNGGASDDSILGGEQNDAITGGPGADLFAPDEVDAAENADFAAGVDHSTTRVSLSGGTLTIQGSRDDEAVQVRYDIFEDTIRVTHSQPFILNSVAPQELFASSDIQRIRVFGMAGDDDVSLFFRREMPLSIDAIIYGGGGNDVLSSADFAGTLRFFGEAGDDAADTQGTVFGRRIFYGGSGNDSLSGGTRDDLLFGDAGNDILVGRGGNDRMQGGSGADQLFGDRGNDTPAGGDGIDFITGGSGADTFVAAERGGGEVIDFQDTIDTATA